VGEKPTQRFLTLLQPLEHSGAVAKSGGVPENQRVPGARFDQNVALGHVGDMRTVADLADVLAQQGARQRGLADVGMREKADVDPAGWDRFAHARSPAVHSAARAASRALISEAAPGLIWIRSAKLARRP